jgi:hypothetical protein
MRLGHDDDLSNVEDRRGSSPTRGPGLRLGLGGTVVLLALSVLLKRNLFTQVAPHHTGPMPPHRAPAAAQARAQGEEEMKRVTVATFNDAQRFWAAELQRRGQRYPIAKLVLFWDATHSGCGAAGAEMGPFYCPADGRVYIDLGFYRELARRFGAPGDFAQAYVIAHEVGHHLQNALGIEERVRQMQRRRPRERNALSVRMELQADCLAGIWAHSTQQRDLLDRGDIEEGLNAAAAVGDDRIQKAATGRVSPESWTHGSAAQRAEWFRRGLRSGRLEDCDTFGRE